MYNGKGARRVQPLPRSCRTSALVGSLYIRMNRHPTSTTFLIVAFSIYKIKYPASIDTGYPVRDSVHLFFYHLISFCFHCLKIDSRNPS